MRTTRSRPAERNPWSENEGFTSAHPSTLICAYLDDTYTLDVPRKAYACMLTGARLTEELAGVASNVGKQEVYSPCAGLTELPTTICGSALAPPQPEKGYSGGRLPCIKVLGAFLGDEVLDPACEARGRASRTAARCHRPA